MSGAAMSPVKKNDRTARSPAFSVAIMLAALVSLYLAVFVVSVCQVCFVVLLVSQSQNFLFFSPFSVHGCDPKTCGMGLRKKVARGWGAG